MGRTYREDEEHSSGDYGGLVFGVRRDTPSALAADGDYIPFTLDGDGRMYVMAMDEKHWHLHEGRSFTTHIDNTVTNTNEMTVIAFNTPATGEFHLFIEATASHLANLYLYENPSIDNDEGVDLVPVNRRRTGTPAASVFSSIEATAEAGKLTYFLETAALNANITTDTELDHLVLLGGGGPKALGAVGEEGIGWQLDHSNQYAVVLKAATGDTATHKIRLDWTEN